MFLSSPHVHQVIVKIMKGDDNFRDLTKSTMMFTNEIHVYRDIIPFFKKQLKENNVTLFNPEDWWTPKVYFADYGVFDGLSDSVETILALENLKPSGYRMGPKIDLDEDHLKLMIKNIAFYHSVSYALKIRKDSKLEELAEQIAPYSYLTPDGKEQLVSYKRLISVGMNRLFDVVEKNPKYQGDATFVANVKRLKENHFEKLLQLMQSFLKKDEVFTIILHGDYVKNNVMFKYDEPEGFKNPKGIKMYDFQEIRYATPVIDLAFFMYMNINSSIRDKLWDSLLQLYHSTMIESLTQILKCEKSDERLKPYSFENFLNHFSRHGFYGVAVSLYYAAWLACSEEELEQISHLFETDMYGDEFFNITQVCGGEDVDDRIVSIAKHASDKGYMKIL